MKTASQIQDLIVIRLMRRHGGTARRWRLAVGPVRVYDPATHGPGNWSVAPTGTTTENAAIERLLDTLRLEVPLAVEG
jgi:hypothetical protein